MIKTITTIALLSLGISLNSYAGDSDRITQLEKEVQELKHRISKLEPLLSKLNADQDVVTSNKGYNSIANWRNLTTNMGYSEVRNLLGEPQRVDGGIMATWYYPNDGEVIFHKNIAWQWREPRE